MLFGSLAVVFLLIGVVGIGLSISAVASKEAAPAIGFGVVGVVVFGLGFWLQTHRIVPTQEVGITRSTISQQLSGPYPAGVVTKPFLGSIHTFPGSTSYERCEQFTPAIKGGIGITVDLCFYYDTSKVDWRKEINHTGSLDDNEIMSVWRNSIVSAVALPLKSFTPEALSDNRLEVELALFENISPWFRERGIPLNQLSFKNWDFTSAEVATLFDKSITSQKRIAEEEALTKAAEAARKRLKYEAETARIVAEEQKKAANALGLQDEEAIVQWLWIKLMSDQGKVPDMVILGKSAESPIAVQAR